MPYAVHTYYHGRRWVKRFKKKSTAEDYATKQRGGKQRASPGGSVTVRYCKLMNPPLRRRNPYPKRKR